MIDEIPHFAVREAREDDLAAMARHALCLKHNEEAMGYRGYAEDDDEYVIQFTNMLVKIFGDSDYYLLVAESEGVVVGSMIGLFRRFERYMKHVRDAYIAFMWVDPEHRRQQYGRAMICAWEDIAAQNGIGLVTCDIWYANEPAMLGMVDRGYGYKHVKLSREIPAIVVGG